MDKASGHNCRSYSFKACSAQRPRHGCLGAIMGAFHTICDIEWMTGEKRCFAYRQCQQWKIFILSASSSLLNIYPAYTDTKLMLWRLAGHQKRPPIEPRFCRLNASVASIKARHRSLEWPRTLSSLFPPPVCLALCTTLLPKCRVTCHFQIQSL